MKTNLTKRLIAALLCAVMLFAVSCSTPGATNPTTSDTASTETPAFPENGATKIVPKTVKLYSTAEKVDDFPVAHYENTPEILLIDTETMCSDLIDKIHGEARGPYTYEETETTLTITRTNGAYCKIDFVEDTMYFNNFDMFINTGHGKNLADLLASPYVDSEGNSIYFQRTSSLAINGLPVIVDLASRDIPLDIYEGKKYIPLQTFNDLFLSYYFVSFVYNGQDLFLARGGALDDSVSDMYYSDAKERSAALIKYTVNELCLFLDLFYGLQDEHGVKYGFETFFEHTGFMEDLTSPDATKSSLALASVLGAYLADHHSAFSMASPYAGSPKLDKSQIVPDLSDQHVYFPTLDQLSKARKKYMPDGVEGYYEVGNTAYVTFDGFTFNHERTKGYNEQSRDRDDTVGLIIYAHSQITREGSPIENVVLDLSCNSGGALDAAVYVIGWMLGYCDFHLTNPVTNSYATVSYKVDVNLDGKFDENDTVADKNLYCLISPVSFSCGNLVPALLKESGMVTLLGRTSAGGACAVQFASLADGSLFQISSPHHITVVSNGAYYTVDRGVEPHYFFGKPESYYDRKVLTDFINNLK